MAAAAEAVRGARLTVSNLDAYFGATRVVHGVSL